uniref:NAD(P)/FAD-dependent oxidoreductase n=1 Tax=Gordonia sp. B7-2 TaxID=3420932 RepID=UPI003D8A6038
MSETTRAVVLGGSVAGLCAAGVLARHFDEVVVLERDELPEGAEHRRGAPQSRHPHFLLNAGRRAIEQIFPGVEEYACSLGAQVRNPALCTASCGPYGWSARARGEMTMLYTSRITLERALRDKARELPDVIVVEQAIAKGLITDRAANRVCGVRWVGPDTGGDTTIDADLVIDALGRGSKVSDWLGGAGWEQPPVDTLDAKATYSSRWYQAPTGDDRPSEWWWDHLAVMPTADRGSHPLEHDYLSTIFPIEDDRWIVFMGSWGLDMPRTVEDFESRAERVRAPAFPNAIKQAEPTSEVYVTKSTGNKWRRYDLMADPPRSLVPVGDSICAFNPLYGQGMSAAAVTATILDECIRSTTELDEVSAEFLTRQRDYLKIPWSLATARDRGYDHAEGTLAIESSRRRALTGRMSWPAFSFIMRAAAEDSVVEEHFARVFNIEESLADMMRNPKVLARLAIFGVRLALRRTRLPEPLDPLQDPPGADLSQLVGK